MRRKGTKLVHAGEKKLIILPRLILYAVLITLNTLRLFKLILLCQKLKII